MSGEKSVNEGLSDKSSQSRSSKTGYMNRGNSGLNPENKSTKNKR
ncbi:hypothetical protein [Clostridium yunnanense]|nr:hypothetical protein [Clostridium yunnanense]